MYLGQEGLPTLLVFKRQGLHPAVHKVSYMAYVQIVRKDLETDLSLHFETTLPIKENTLAMVSSQEHKILLDDYKVRPELNKHKNI